MVATLKEVKEQTSLIFEEDDEKKHLVLPTPPTIWKDKLEALEAAGLEKQRSNVIFDMRRWQAKEMGFEEIESATMVKMLMGEAHTDSYSGSERQTYEYAYDHHNHVLLGKDWGGPPTIFRLQRRKGLWHLPPFSKQTIWEVQFGKLDYLKREFPYGVILRINEVKALNLFNVFHVMAPMEAWEKKTDIDPIVVATIWELPPVEDKKNRQAGQVAHFFLAQW
jgi:hypothetical protein